MTATTARARRLRRTVMSALGAVALVVAVPALAAAHVEVKPDAVAGGDFAEVAFSVPNERDDASTTKLRVLLPTDQPLASVQTTPLPGWSVRTKERTLDNPIELEGATISKVVSQITWKATDGGIAPGQFEDFPVSLGVLPTSGQLVFKAVQTYSDGEVVLWNETAVGSAEPEHPSPTLTLTAPEGEGGGAETTAPPTQTPATTAGSPDEGSAAADGSGDEGGGDWVAIALSVLALVVSLGALGLSWKRSRP